MNARSITLVAVGALAGIAAIALSPKQSRPAKTSCAVHADCPANSRCGVLDQQRVCLIEIPPPPASAIIRVLSLGRHAAAADLVWLRVVQFVGDHAAQAANYQGLAKWLLLATDLNPDFDEVYRYAGALLPTSRSSASEAELILARGEEALGENWEKAMWRGFVAYYGAQSPKAAAEHFERSARLGGPKYLVKRAAALRNEAKNCRSLQRNLAQMRLEFESGRKDLLSDKQVQKILIGCIESKLSGDIAAFRINTGESPKTIEELVDAGIRDEVPPSPPGQCWFLEAHAGYLAPCVDGKRSDVVTRPKEGGQQ